MPIFAVLARRYRTWRLNLRDREAVERFARAVLLEELSPDAGTCTALAVYTLASEIGHAIAYVLEIRGRIENEIDKELMQIHQTQYMAQRNTLLTKLAEVGTLHRNLSMDEPHDPQRFIEID